MFPDELLSGAEIEAEEVGVDGECGGAAGTCSGSWGAAAAFESERKFVVVGNAQPVEAVGDYYFGLGTDSFAAGCVELGRIRLKGLAFVFL